jgi:hypothetical protein
MSREDLVEFKRNMARRGVGVRLSREMTAHERERPQLQPMRRIPRWVSVLDFIGFPEFIMVGIERWLGLGDFDPVYIQWAQDMAAWRSRRPTDESAQVRRLEEKARQEEREIDQPSA